MNLRHRSILASLTCAGLLVGCAAVVPPELLHARAAYRRASAGPAAQLAPAELHVASAALAVAEKSFQLEPESFLTKDRAYIAQRKAQVAEAVASIAIEKRAQDRAEEEYLKTQTQVVADTKKDLGTTQDALAASEEDGETTQRELSAEHAARSLAEQQTADTRDALDVSERSGEMTRARLADEQEARAAAERAGEATRVRLADEQEARAAADRRASIAQAALVKLAAVKDEARGMVITLSGSLLFASAQSVLLPAARARLDEVAAVLLTMPERKIVVEGHTDSQGSDADNMDLSQARADAVRTYLVSRGYDADLITAHGLGEGYPVTGNESPEGRANNRRVEIVVEKTPIAAVP